MRAAQLDCRHTVRQSVTPHMESDNLQPAQAQPHNEDIVKEGWLMKRGEVIKNWRPRSV